MFINQYISGLDFNYGTAICKSRLEVIINSCFKRDHSDLHQPVKISVFVRNFVEPITNTHENYKN